MPATKILIVDDNPVSTKLLEIILQRAGYVVVAAKTGMEALAQLRRMSDIDLVITDIMMPEMSGLELVRTLKEDPAWQDIPVIVSSALGDLETVKEALKLGCRSYVLKPVKADQLRSRVHEALEQQRPILRHPSQVMAESGLDEKSYREVVTQVAEQVSQLMPRLEFPSTGLGPGLLEQIQNLMESAALLGAERLEQTTHRLNLRHGETLGALSPSDAEELLDQLKLLHAALKQILGAPKTS